ncbi:hypothetical protein [Embleya sp. NPDC001921]
MIVAVEAVLPSHAVRLARALSVSLDGAVVSEATFAFGDTPVKTLEAHARRLEALSVAIRTAAEADPGGLVVVGGFRLTTVTEHAVRHHLVGAEVSRRLSRLAPNLIEPTLTVHAATPAGALRRQLRLQPDPTPWEEHLRGNESRSERAARLLAHLVATDRKGFVVRTHSPIEATVTAITRLIRAHRLDPEQ